MDGLSIRSILELLAPPFTGSSWIAILFQLYSILCLGSYSIYRIIKAKGASVIILSKQRLIISVLMVSAIFLGCHQLLTLFDPASYRFWGKVGFFFASFFIVTFIPFNSSNALTLWMNKIADGPYIVQRKEEQEAKNEDGEDFWACGSNFVRRTLSVYYIQGLYLPLLICSLSSGYVQMVLMISWGFCFVVMLLLRIHSVGGPILFGYFGLLYLAAHNAS